MFQCDEDEDRETIESGDKRFAFEDKSNADVCKATDTSNLKELLLLRKDLLPVLRDGENNNGGENASLGENHGDEGDVDNLSLWNAAPNDRNFNSSISAQRAGEQSSLVSGQVGNGFQDVRELSENQGELAENPPEAIKTSEDSAAIVDVSDENKNLAYKEADIKKTQQFNLPYEGIKNSQIQRYSNHIEYNSSYIGGGSDNENLKHSLPYKAETVTRVADETCREENGFGNEDLVLAETNQQLPKGSSGLARGVLAEDGGAFDLVSGSGISVEPSASHNLNADTEENGLKMKQERNLMGKDDGYEEKDATSTNDAVDDLKKLPKDVEKSSTEIRDQVTQMDDVCQKQIEDLTLTQSGGSCSSLSELQTVNANVRNKSSDVKHTKILDSKAHFSTEVVRESNELEKETLVSDCSEDKKLDTDALVKVIVPDSEGASLDDATDHDSDKSPSVPVGMTIACHLPSLEDGLSSGHVSDSDEMASSCQAQASGDALYLPLTAEVQDRPALLASSQQSRDTKEGSHASVDLVSDTRQRDVYLAIQDIRSAIEKSKTVKLISPSVGYEEKSKEADDYRSVEPVWITRREQATDLQKQTPKNQNKPSSTSPELGNNHKRPQNITHKHNRQYSALPAADSDQDYDSDSLTDPRNKTRNASSRQLSDSSMALDRVKNVTLVDGNASSITQRPIQDLTERSEPPIEANSRHSEQPEGSEESATDISVAQSQADEPQKKAKRPDDRNLEEYSEKAQIRSVEGGGEYSTDDETDELLNKQYVQSEKIDIPELSTSLANQSQDERQKSHARKVALRDPTNETVLMEGVLFRASYLGSTQLTSEGQPSKRMRMVQAQEAVSRIKAPEGETQPSTEVELFVSAEKIMVLNTDLQEIMMDHALRTISYIADIGEILVVMARRGPTAASATDRSSTQRRSQTKLCCHVFESDEAQFIAQSIGRAFQASYVEFLKANGIDNPTHIQDLDYQEVLNQQEIFSEELSLFSNREMQKEITVSKAKGEPLGVVIVESGWGSLLPTVVLANMSPVGAAARCGQLNIGDQIMSIDGVSLVGLPLAKCQSHIKSARSQLVVRLAVVSCPPVVEVLIKRPDVKYQLGFSVQDGVICSLLRGGIAERGGVRVGHRIIEINGRSVVAVSHETIVELLAASVGEIQMKTMPTSIFQLLTGQDVPHYI